MNKRELAETIRRLKNGTATPAEKELLERHWKRALTDTSGLKNHSKLEREEIKKEMFDSITSQLGLAKNERRLPVFNSLTYKIAASLLLLFMVTGVWFMSRTVAVFPVVAENAMVEVRTHYGEQITIKLPDESSVVLNGNTKLTYRKNWLPSSSREVWIDGEGFFAVQHTKNHQKFVVHTREGLNVEVLGTKFNVKSRVQGSEVLLTEGRVKLNVNSEAHSAVILKPGEMATMKEKKLSKRVVEDKQYTSWVRSKLYFNNTPLSELAQTLKDTYGVHVSFQNEELKHRQLSGEISSASIDDILFAVAQTFDIEVTRQSDNSVIFSLKAN